MPVASFVARPLQASLFSPCPENEIDNVKIVFRRTLLSASFGLLLAAPMVAGAQTSEGRKPFAAFSASAQTLRDSLVSTARGQIGTRYKFGANSPGKALDCSSLVKYVMGALNFVLPRTARQQATEGEEIPTDLAALKPGDLLTFGKGNRISHIGIYVGNGRMVHASTARKSVIETDLSPRNPLIKQWKGVRRIVADAKVEVRDSIFAMADSLK